MNRSPSSLHCEKMLNFFLWHDKESSALNVQLSTPTAHGEHSLINQRLVTWLWGICGGRPCEHGPSSTTRECFISAFPLSFRCPIMEQLSVVIKISDPHDNMHNPIVSIRLLNDNTYWYHWQRILSSNRLRLGSSSFQLLLPLTTIYSRSFTIPSSEFTPRYSACFAAGSINTTTQGDPERNSVRGGPRGRYSSTGGRQ
jgi:hypothetical protein